MKFFSLIYQGDVHTATDEKIVPAKDFSTLMHAHEILEKAKEDAATFKKETAEKCEVLRSDAQKEGFEEGLGRFNAHLLNFDLELKKLRHEMMQQVLPLALKAAKKIVAKELETHPDTIVDMVLQALAPITQNRRITIYVHKSDKERLEAGKPRIQEILQQVESLRIQERDDVEPQGCIIETESGIINASIENQWRALESAFAKYMKH
jgi:type III secretion protein L